MHMYRRQTNFFGGQGIVGAQASAWRGGGGAWRAAAALPHWAAALAVTHPPRPINLSRLPPMQVPLGAGLALAHQYRGDGGVGVAMYGDGAANQARWPA